MVRWLVSPHPFGRTWKPAFTICSRSGRSQHRARPHLRGLPFDLDRAFAGVFRRAGCIEQPLTFCIKVTQPIGLQPISQNAKQKMAGQVRGAPPKHVLPTDLETTDVLASGSAGPTLTRGMPGQAARRLVCLPVASA